jgi:hypothetical protein
MTDLLDRALKAAGGIERWNALSTVTARVSWGGPYWEMRGHPGLAGTDLVVADLHRQHIVSAQQPAGRTVIFDKDAEHLLIAGLDGSITDDEHDLRPTFPSDPGAHWSRAQAAYFRSYGLWHYLAEPYLLAWKGVTTREAVPWTGDGETWRVLEAAFPASLDTQSAVQRYYYDNQARLRRVDYEPVVAGGVPVAHYIRGEAVVGGVTVPVKRHVHPRNPDGTPDPRVLITVDLADICFS